MAIIQLILSVAVLGILYFRMIKREVPEQISIIQAGVPVAFGMASFWVSFQLFLAIGGLLTKSGLSLKGLPSAAASFIQALIMAGLPEELAKFAFIIIAIILFRSKIKNVYEYILIGAGVGAGFTLLEEFYYGEDAEIATVVFRILTIASHMIFGVIMAKHLGFAAYNKAAGRGPAAGECILALIIPMVIHTLYDSLTATNTMMTGKDNKTVMIGIILSVAATAALFILQFIVLIGVKKNTEKYCDMKLQKDI